MRKNIFRRFKKIFKIIDTPAEVTGALALYLICKKIKVNNPGIKVLLSGVGADEIFLAIEDMF